MPEETFTLPDAELSGKWFVDMSAVNINDLLNSRPGAIVRCKYLPAVQYVPPHDDSYDRIAGLISDCA